MAASSSRRARVALAPWRGGRDATLPAELGALAPAVEVDWWEAAPVAPDFVIVVSAATSSDLDGGALVERLVTFAKAGGAVLALGAAVEALLLAGLLPGAISPAIEVPSAGRTHVRVEGRPTPFSWAIPAGRILPLGEGAAVSRYLATAEEVRALLSAGRVILRCCDDAGGAANGADGIAGLCDESGRVAGLLTSGASPLTALSSALGRQILACLRAT